MRNSPKSRIYVETLEEIAASDDLMKAFSDETEQYYFVPAPKDFSQSVLKKSRSLDVQVTVRTNHVSKKLQFFIYSLQVGTAVAGALFLLFALPNSTAFSRSFTGEQRIEVHVSNRTRQLSDSILEFSYDMFYWR